MKKRRTFGHYSKHFFITVSALSLFMLTGCARADKAGTQARTDLTAEHVRGLYSGMVRNDVEDLLGTSDKSLAEHESVEVYNLADGTTAVLRYRDDQLLGAYLRDKNNAETSLFYQNNAGMTGVNGVNDNKSSLNGSETNTGNGRNETNTGRESDNARETNLNNETNRGAETRTLESETETRR